LKIRIIIQTGKPISKPNDIKNNIPGQLDIYDLPQSSTDAYMDGPGF